jgi:iron-sulfur cluster repair protein YtfE (RIC family)
MPNPSYTIEVLNAIRDTATTNYADRVPAATRANIAAVGMSITTYPETLNEFTTTLVEKIGLTLFSNKMSQNKLAPFKKGLLPFGSSIEEIFVEMAAAAAYDKDGANVLARTKPEILVRYHNANREDTYTITISDAQVKRAFTSLSGVSNLLEKIVQSMYSGANHDEYIIMKELLAKYDANYFDYMVDAVDDAAAATTLVKSVRKAVSDVSYMSDKYNKAAVMTYTPKENLVLLVNKDIMAHINVDVLAAAFNINKSDFEPTIIEVDDFGTMANTYALLIEEDFFMVYDTLVNVEQIRNPKGMFTNEFLNIQQVLSLSEFKNAIRFKKYVAG